MSKTDKLEPVIQNFHAYADDATVLGVGSMDVENSCDRVTLNGDVVLTRDRQGLLLAKQLQAVLDSVVRALEADRHLPEQVQTTAPVTTKNPFA